MRLTVTRAADTDHLTAGARLCIARRPTESAEITCQEFRLTGRRIPRGPRDDNREQNREQTHPCKSGKAISVP